MLRVVSLVVTLAIAAGCQGSATSTPPSTTPSATSSAAPTLVPVVSNQYDIGDGRTLRMTCYGNRSPTVVFQPGGTDVPGQDAATMSTLLAIGARARACVYNRDDLDLPYDAIPERSIFDHIADLRALLRAAKVDCPCIWAGTSFGGVFALASALDDPASTAGLVIIDTDFPVLDGTQRCIDLGIPSTDCAPDPGDALAITWGKQVADAVKPLPGIPVRILTSDTFGPDCPTGWNCASINAKIVTYQASDWATLSSDFSQTIVHVLHDDLNSGAQAEIIATVSGLL